MPMSSPKEPSHPLLSLPHQLYSTLGRRKVTYRTGVTLSQHDLDFLGPKIGKGRGGRAVSIIRYKDFTLDDLFQKHREEFPIHMTLQTGGWASGKWKQWKENEQRLGVWNQRFRNYKAAQARRGKSLWDGALRRTEDGWQWSNNR